jgi:hypothetical protein
MQCPVHVQCTHARRQTEHSSSYISGPVLTALLCASFIHRAQARGVAAALTAERTLLGSRVRSVRTSVFYDEYAPAYSYCSYCCTPTLLQPILLPNPTALLLCIPHTRLAHRSHAEASTRKRAIESRCVPTHHPITTAAGRHAAGVTAAARVPSLATRCCCAAPRPCSAPTPRGTPRSHEPRRGSRQPTLARPFSTSSMAGGQRLTQWHWSAQCLLLTTAALCTHSHSLPVAVRALWTLLVSLASSALRALFSLVRATLGVRYTGASSDAFDETFRTWPRLTQCTHSHFRPCTLLTDARELHWRVLAAQARGALAPSATARHPSSLVRSSRAFGTLTSVGWRGANDPLLRAALTYSTLDAPTILCSVLPSRDAHNAHGVCLRRTLSRVSQAARTQPLSPTHWISGEADNGSHTIPVLSTARVPHTVACAALCVVQSPPIAWIRALSQSA